MEKIPGREMRVGPPCAYHNPVLISQPLGILSLHVAREPAELEVRETGTGEVSIHY